MSTTYETHFVIFSYPTGSSEPYGVLGLEVQTTDNTQIIRRQFIKPERMVEGLTELLNEKYGSKESDNRSRSRRSKKTVSSAVERDQNDSEETTVVSGESSQGSRGATKKSEVELFATSKLPGLRAEFYSADSPLNTNVIYHVDTEKEASRVVWAVKKDNPAETIVPMAE